MTLLFFLDNYYQFLIILYIELSKETNIHLLDVYIWKSVYKLQY